MKKNMIVMSLVCFCVSNIYAQKRPVIYQMMVRLFGNKNTTNTYYGSLEQNGVGKFTDVTDRALDSLKTLGLSHIWYTGVIAHASMTDYSSFDIQPDDPDVVKGRAGSPYAIRDYYDVDPDLASDVNNRMQEYQQLIERTHRHGLKVIMDFIPNHVARTYHSNVRPSGIIDFGAEDDTAKVFSTKNDFYYIPNSSFIVPNGVDAGGPHFHSPLKDGKFAESPAKATGNDVFKPNPSIDDWYETIKLNYGIDYQNKRTKHFSPIPVVWEKMLSILQYWAAKGVDGFRCDMAEMVPVEFWHWATSKIKAQYPNILFIAEAYNPKVYQSYIKDGGFDYLYDKVGMYDAVKKLIKNEGNANVREIDSIEKSFPSTSLIRFLENHDEERIASTQFANNPFLAIPGMVIMATFSTNPVMIYFGQEVGEKGEGKEGFGGDDGRSSLFDYWGVPAQQAWMNDGKFDGALLSDEQKNLRKSYQNLLKVVNNSKTIQQGKTHLFWLKSLNDKQLAYFRALQGHLVLVIVNFDRTKTIDQKIVLPLEIIRKYKIRNNVHLRSLIDQSVDRYLSTKKGIEVKVSPSSALILDIQ